METERTFESRVTTGASRLVDRIGNTPLLRLKRVIPDHISPDVEIYVKAEWFNPGGSVKDRPAYGIIREALESGKLSPGKTLIDSTSGNTGIAYAMIGATMGFPVKLIMPKNVSTERKKIITAFGTEIVYSDPLEGSDGARAVVSQLVDENPDQYFFADQYSNPANWKSHYETTGPEIWRDTRGRITHFVGGMGTSGTIMGNTRFLKEQDPLVHCVSLQPEPFHGIEGWKNMDSATPVGIYDPALPDRKLTVPTEPAYVWARELAKKEGLLVSPSAGAAFYGALEVAKELDSGVIVCVFADSGDKYLSTSLFA